MVASDPIAYKAEHEQHGCFLGQSGLAGRREASMLPLDGDAVLPVFGRSLSLSLSLSAKTNVGKPVEDFRAARGSLG
jgi:hypothetical protein